MYRTLLITVLSVGILAFQTARADGQSNEVKPKMGGTDNDPLIQLELAPIAAEEPETLLAALNQLPWASRTAVLPRYPGSVAEKRLHPKAVAVIAVGERQWADIAT